MNHPLSRPHRTHRSDQGFTLIELLIVIAILAVLAAILIPSYSGAQKKPYDAAALQCGRAIITAETARKAETGEYAGAVSDLGQDVQEVCDNAGVMVGTDREQAKPDSVGSNTLSVSPTNIAFQVWHPSGSGHYNYNHTDGTRALGSKLNRLVPW